MKKSDIAMLAKMRMADNLAETGHPMHHLTADGTVVDSDPTLEHWLKKLEGTGYRPVTPSFDAGKARPAVPVNRTHYGVDPYAEGLEGPYEVEIIPASDD